tara:strand:+ start:1432 stop:1887 length:456 start_codon:yes stop_codon:yes gene_type:complete
MSNSNLTKLLERAKQIGFNIQVDGEKLRVRGPKGHEEIVNEIKLHKADVIEAMRGNESDFTDKIEELKDRLRKGMDWFSAVDPDYWGEKGFSSKKVKNGKTLEEIMQMQLEKWDSLEKILRKLYDYEDCIFDSGSCPDNLVVRCMKCADCT